MKRTLLFLTCVLASMMVSAQGSNADYFDYIPFVEKGKTWHVVNPSANRSYHFEQYMLTNEEVVENGKTYVKMNQNADGSFVLYDAALLREENRKVYLFIPSAQKEILVFDYSLKAGDTYEGYSLDGMGKVSYKVVSVDDYLEGPEIVRYDNNQAADRKVAQHRYLRRWTLCRTDDNSIQKTWIEGVGSLNGPLGNLYDLRYSFPGSQDYLAYVVANHGADIDSYLPFPFHDEFRQIHGCNLPTGAENKEIDERRHHHLSYELDGDRLHVYGDAFTQCGPNNYACFYEKPTDDPFVHKIEFIIQEVEPMMDCMALHAIDLYVPGFDPNMNYIVVDNYGEEHPVINKAIEPAYRPFIEEGKTWIVRVYSDNLSHDQWTEYLYIDGDTIINGQTAKRMLCDRVDSKYDTTGEYVGAWYEQDKKVYFGLNKFDLLYDFTLSSGDSICQSDYTKYVVNKSYGGIAGFKGAYYEFLYNGDVMDRWFEGVGSESWPYINNRWGHVGHTGALLACIVGDEVIYLNDEYEFGTIVLGARKDRIDFTHTIKIRPKTRMMKEAEAQSLYGEYSSQQLGINLNALDEAYQVSITDEAGKVVYEKTVNAGSIVGLNIDISAYAKGRYTVTVENSNESFTGQFETQTTGISLAPAHSQKEGAIYNLQGQRINSLRKGLNIVNGRKVYKY